MYDGIVPFDTKQKVFVCEVILSAALDRIECVLPPNCRLQEFALRRAFHDSWIASAKEVAGMGLATFYAQLTGDGMAIEDALELSGFEKAATRFVERRSKKSSPFREGELTQFDCRPYAEKFVRAAFKEYSARTPTPVNEHAACGRNRRVMCKSGLKGWEGRLRDQYRSFSEFEACSMTYGLAFKLGFKTAREAWDANPLVQGSVEPSDYRVSPRNQAGGVTSRGKRKTLRTEV